MKKFAKMIRVLTVAPVYAFLLLTVLHFTDKAFMGYFYLIGLFTLVVLPLLAYPIQDKFNIIKGDKRSSERKLAIIFSVIGYIIGFLVSVILSHDNLEKIVYLTYLFSVSLIFINTFVLKINASGHMCGVVGPIIAMIYVYGEIFYVLFIVLILVVWSSLYLKRHKKSELLLGSVIPILSLFISIIIFL